MLAKLSRGDPEPPAFAGERLVNTGAIITYTILGAPYYKYSIFCLNIPPNPILIIKAPIVVVFSMSESLVGSIPKYSSKLFQEVMFVLVG